MRTRILIFLGGFVAGVVALYVFLFETGVLKPYLRTLKAEAATRAAVEPQSAAPVRASMHPVRRANATGTTVFDGNQLIAPIDGLRASDVRDTFNDARRGGHPHEATDIMEPRGTPVHAMLDGVIEKLFLSKAGGNTIYEFDNSGTYCYYYAHLDHYAEGLQVGQTVRQGDIIGYVGSTGDANENAPHLHLAIFQLGPEKHWWQGTAINPYPMLMQVAQH